MKSGCPSSCWESCAPDSRWEARERATKRPLRRFLLKPGVGILYADDQTTQHYANVYRQLRKQGTPIPTNDMWIAALVLQHSLVLFARDAHFDALPQLTRFSTLLC